MFLYMGYRHRPRFTYELAALGLELRVTCWSCKHVARIGGDAISAILIARRRSQAIDAAGEVLRCSVCRTGAPEVLAKPIADARERAEERRMARG